MSRLDNKRTKTFGWNPNVNVIHKPTKSTKPKSTSVTTTPAIRFGSDRIINAEEVMRGFIEDEETDSSRFLFESETLSLDMLRIYDSLLTEEFEKRRTIVETREFELANDSKLQNAITIASTMNAFTHLSNSFERNFKGSFYRQYQTKLVMTGSWLCYLLTGLSVCGKTVEAYIKPSNRLTTLTEFLDRLKTESGPVKVVDYRSFEINENDYIDVNYSNGVIIRVDISTGGTPTDGFNLNQLTFDTVNGIGRQCDVGPGMDWTTLFMSLYTRNTVMCDSRCYDQNTRVLSLGVLVDESDSDDSDEESIDTELRLRNRAKSLVRGTTLQLMEKYVEMDKNGIRCQNFSPPIEDGGSCSIEQDQVDGPTVRTKCGHVFGLDNLIRNVSGIGSMRSSCPLCRQLLEFEC